MFEQQGQCVRQEGNQQGQRSQQSQCSSNKGYRSDKKANGQIKPMFEQQRPMVKQDGQRSNKGRKLGEADVVLAFPYEQKC